MSLKHTVLPTLLLAAILVLSLVGGASANAPTGGATYASTPATTPLAAPGKPSKGRPMLWRAQEWSHFLGFNPGRPDGLPGPETDRAFCTFANLMGKPAKLAPPSRSLVRQMLTTAELPLPARTERNYLEVNKTCQTLIVVRNGRYMRIMTASTGMPGFETTSGKFSFSSIGPKWQESTIYPGGMMYKPMFFNGDQGIHGEPTDDMALGYFQSHGCVRTFQSEHEWLVREFTPVLRRYRKVITYVA